MLDVGSCLYEDCFQETYCGPGRCGFLAVSIEERDNVGDLYRISLSGCCANPGSPGQACSPLKDLFCRVVLGPAYCLPQGFYGRPGRIRSSLRSLRGVRCDKVFGSGSVDQGGPVGGMLGHLAYQLWQLAPGTLDSCSV